MGIGLVNTLGHGDTHQIQHLDGLVHGFLLGSLGLVDEGDLIQLLANGKDGIQRGHRLLEDHSDLLTTDAVDLTNGHLSDVVILSDAVLTLSRKADRAGSDLTLGTLQQTHNGHAGHGLAAAGLAHDTHGHILGNIEGNTVNGLHHTLLRVEVGVQILDLQNVIGISHFCEELRFLGLTILVGLQTLHFLGIGLGNGADLLTGEIMLIFSFCHSLSPRFRIQGIPEAVAYEVEAQNSDDDAHTCRYPDIQMILQHILVGRNDIDHSTPSRIGRLDAQIQVRQGGFVQDHGAQAQSHLHDQLRHNIGHQVLEDLSAGGITHSLGSHHVLLLTEAQDLASNQTGNAGPGNEGQVDHQQINTVTGINVRGIQNRRNNQQNGNTGQAHEHVGKTHDHRIYPAAKVTCYATQDNAQNGDQADSIAVARAASRCRLRQRISSRIAEISFSIALLKAPTAAMASLYSRLHSKSLIFVFKAEISASSCLKYPFGDCKSNTGGTKPGILLLPARSPEKAAR